MLLNETTYLFISDNELMDSYLKRITRRHFREGFCTIIVVDRRRRREKEEPAAHFPTEI